MNGRPLAQAIASGLTPLISLLGVARTLVRMKYATVAAAIAKETQERS